MKLGLIKKKILMFSVVGVLAAGVATASGVIVYQHLNPKNVSSVDKDEEKKTKFKFLSVETEKLADPDDVGVMIMDCDSSDSFITLSNAKPVHKSGRYMQGTGALSVGGFANHRNNGVSTGYFKPVDISDYKDGSIHFSFYVNDAEKLGNTDIQVELTSSGVADKEELCWKLPTSILNDGWNDVYFSLADAALTGEPNLEKINYYRMFALGAEPGLEFIFDAVYATNTEGTPLVKNQANVKTATTKPGYLMDCDSLRGVSSNVTLMLTTSAAEHKEGTGAVAVANPSSTWMQANLKQVDITPYEKGYVSAWVYINDASYCKDGKIYLELTSSGTCDQNEICWIVNGSTLKTGWNEMLFKIGSALDSSKEKVDKTKINYLRMFGMNCDSNLVVLLDAFKLNQPDVVTPQDGMLFTCDNLDRLTVTTDNTFSITNKSGEFKQGTGAFKAVGQGNVFWSISPRDSYNISKYAKGGLHLWLYASDPAKLGKVVSVEISSSGRFDVNEYQWQVLSESLDAGWNELYLNFADAIITKGEPDMSNINYMRVFSTNITGEVTMMLDDVRAVMPETASNIPGLISNCDSQRILKLVYGKLTTESGQYKEGTGAFINTSASQTRIQFDLNTPVDISAYEDGAVHFWFYIDKPEDIYTYMMFEVGNDGNNFYRWMLKSSDLEKGWNELTLSFAEASLKWHEPDLSKVSYVRVLQASNGTYKQMTTIVDDIRAIKMKGDELPANTVGSIIKAVEYKSGKPGEGFSVARNTIDGLYMPYITAEAWDRNGSPTVYIDGIELTGEDLSSYDLSKLNVEFWIKSTTDIDKKPLAFRMGNGKIGATYETPIFNFETENLQLKAGEWTKVTLNLSDALNPEYVGNIQINWLRLLVNGLTEDTTIYLTGMHLTGVKTPAEEPDTPVGPENPENPDDTPQTPVKTDVILNCDATDNVTLTSDKDSTVSVTTAEGEFKEGTGAYKVVGNANMAMTAILKQKVDISDYAAGGIHLWLYVNDLSKVSNNYVAVEVSSSEENDVDEYQWNVAKASLQNGWNELYLPFSTALVKSADLTKICRVRIYTACTDEVSFIVDDVKAVLPVVKDANVIVDAEDYSFSGHTLDVQTTTIAGTVMQYKEETAYTGYNNKYRVDFNNSKLKAVDLSSYGSLNDVAITFWMRSDVEQKITLSASSFLQLTTTDNKVWKITSGSIELKAGEWTKVTFNLGSVTADGVTTASTFKSMRFLLQDLKQDSKIAVTDMKLVEDNVIADAEDYVSNKINNEFNALSDVQNVTLPNGQCISYKTYTTDKVNKIDMANRSVLKNFNNVDLNNYTISFWIRASVDKNVTLNGSNNVLMFVKGNAEHIFKINSGTVSLKANEWTKVTLKLSTNAITGSNQEKWDYVRLLISNLGQNETYDISDMLLVEDNVIATAENYGSNQIGSQKNALSELKTGTLPNGQSVNYRTYTTDKANQIDMSNNSLAKTFDSSMLKDHAITFWIRSSKTQTITLKYGAPFKVIQFNNANNNQDVFNVQDGDIDLKADEWTKVTLSLDSYAGAYTNKTTTWTSVRILMHELGLNETYDISDISLVQP